MLRIWYNNVVDTQRRVVEVSGNRIRIGRHENNELVLHSPYIADQAAVLYKLDGKWELNVLGMNGLRILQTDAPAEQLNAGERRILETDVSIELFPYTLSLDLPRKAELTEANERARLDEQVSTLLAAVHRELLDRMNMRRGMDPNQQADPQYLLSLERHLETIAQSQAAFQSSDSMLVPHLAGCALRDCLLDTSSTTELVAGSSGSQAEQAMASSHTAHAWSKMVSHVPERERELLSTAAYLARNLVTAGTARTAPTTLEIESGFWSAWRELRSRVHAEFKTYLALRKIKKDIKDIVFGYGPLEDLLRMPSITEIMVVDRDRIFVESRGVIENTGRRFISDEVVESIIQRIVGRVGRRIDKSQPLVDARLQDGSRVNAVIAPLAVSGPTLTIRKFPARKIAVQHLVALGAMPAVVADFLRAVVLARKNIVVSGGTGTGKTTLLNCLSDFIPDDERIVTVEDTAELQLAKQHVVRLETKVANVEGAGEYTIRDLVKNALRMRPDRVVVGECRGAEALDMLQAMNTGHDGSLTTIHANDAHDVALRLEVLVQMAADLPVTSIRQQIGAAIDVIVQLRRMRDGRRIISQITECVGVDPHHGLLELRDLYLLDPHTGILQPTGSLPTFIGELLSQGMLELDNFYQQAATDEELPLDAMRDQPGQQPENQSAPAPGKTEGAACPSS